MYATTWLQTLRYNLIKLKFYAFPFYLSFQMWRNFHLVEDGHIFVEVEAYISRLDLWQVNSFQDCLLNTVHIMLIWIG